MVHAWWMLLLAALGLLWLATGRRIARVEALTNHPTWSVDAPARDAASATGFAQGQRRLVVPGHHAPSFWWIMEAQQAVEQGRFRLRHIDHDAAPEGRETRRTAPYRWWLIAVGWLQGTVTGETPGQAIERGALFADPLLLALLLVGGAVYLARCHGPGAAAGFVAGGIALFPLAANFQPGAPDAHSLAWVLALGSVLPLLVAWPGDGSGRRPRFHFVAAGIMGGLGFWNDAPSQAPVLLAVFLGGLAGSFIRLRGAGERPAPLPWRAWAGAGALTTLGAALFEFAPDHLSWSLDAVHPVQAVAWWGVGGLLHAADRWFRSGRAGFGGRERAFFGAAVLALAAWPVVAITGGTGALLAPDFYALKLANHPRAGLAANLGAWLGQPGGSGAKWATLLPGLLLPVLLGLVLAGEKDRERRSRLGFVLAAAAGVMVLAFLQLRWWNLLDVFLLIALALLFAPGAGGRGVCRLVAALALLPGLIVGFPPAVTGKPPGDLSPLEAQVLIARDFAYGLVKRGGAEPIVLFSTPLFSSAAAYYGGFRTVVSNDDGNRSGYDRAVRLASASTEQEMSVLLRSRGITHVALPLWDPILDQLVRIGHGLPAGPPLPQNALAVALREWDFPPWMRPLDCLVPNEPGFTGYELRAFALQPDQEPDMSLSHLADFFLERGQVREALAVTASLKAYPRSAAALGAVANVHFARRDGAALKQTLEALIPQLGRRTARNLPADRRISLAALLARTNHADLARDQLVACFAALDPAALRTLTPGSVVNLVTLSRSLDIRFPDQELEALALDLLPPTVRANYVRP